MRKIIPPGTVVGSIGGLPSNMIIHNPLTDRMSAMNNFQGELLGTSEDYVAIPGTSDFISGKANENEPAIYHNDGTITLLTPPGSAVTNDCKHCCVSGDGSTIAWISDISEKIAVYDVATGNLKSHIDVGHNVSSTNHSIVLNTTGSIILLVSWSQPIKTFDTDTGNNLFTDSVNGNYNSAAYNQVLDKFLFARFH